MEFEWDETKAARNLEKHGVSFEVVHRLDWAKAIIRLDERVDYGEQRWQSLHVDEDGRRYVVVFTERDGRLRVVVVRRAHAKEQRKWAK